MPDSIVARGGPPSNEYSESPPAFGYFDVEGAAELEAFDSWEFRESFFLFFFFGFLSSFCRHVASSLAIGAPWVMLGESDDPVVEEPPCAKVNGAAAIASAAVKIVLLILLLSLRLAFRVRYPHHVERRRVPA